MVGRLLVAVARQIVRRRTTRVAGDAPDAVRPPQRLVGELLTLRELAFVLPGTAAVVLPPSGPAERRTAGSVLMPAWRREPLAECLVLNLRPVTVEVVLGPLRTREGAALDGVTLRLVVAFVDPPPRLLDLARQYGDGLDAELLRRLSEEIGNQVRNAVAMHRLADLEQASLSAVLMQGWLSCTFVDGLLDRRDFQVLDVAWPTAFARMSLSGYQVQRVSS